MDNEVTVCDIHLMGKKTYSSGNLHLITKISQEISYVLQTLGYQPVESSEIETENYNFELLGMPNGHPARDEQGTFYLNNKLLLRTHTSGTQIRIFSKYSNKEIKFFTIGKVYRRDETDSTHTHQFTQLEIVAVGKDISFAFLKSNLEFLLKEILGKDCQFRFRPSYFPFTVPSVEIDARCFKCYGKGCLFCKQDGWIELGGAGLIHPQVLANCNYENDRFTGLAMGLGVERILMIKYGIDSLGHFYNNDLRFLRQFF